LAAPTPCSITVGGTVTYTVSNFALATAVASGGGTVYAAEDIAIDLATGGGLTGLLTFTKSNVNPGAVFLANPGQTSAFTLTYDVTLSAAAPGSVAYDSQFIVGINETTAADGSGQVQWVVPPVSCTASTIDNQDICNVPPQPLTISLGDILSMQGNGGNVAVQGFTNLLAATFEPAVPPTLSLAFAPPAIDPGGISTLTTTLGNPEPALSTLTAPLVVSLPPGVVVAGVPNAGSTCVGGGSPAAIAGGSTVTLPAGNTIPAGGSCTLTVDVTSNVAGTHLVSLAAGALVTDTGANAAAADAGLEVLLLGAQAIPSLSTWGVMLLAGLLAGAGWLAIRRG
jgi:hypothetical protein